MMNFQSKQQIIRIFMDSDQQIHPVLFCINAFEVAETRVLAALKVTAKPVAPHQDGLCPKQQQT